jgi:adenylate kinase family enzyme
VDRVAIVGPAGSGKTELALALGARTSLPVIHLDPIFWGADWQPVSAEDCRRTLAEVVARDRWIVDGNFLEVTAASGSSAQTWSCSSTFGGGPA